MSSKRYNKNRITVYHHSSIKNHSKEAVAETASKIKESQKSLMNLFQQLRLC